jgi:hypothetical protein
VKKILKIIFFLLLLVGQNSYAQFEDEGAIDDDDLSLGGDIFTDFNEDIPGAQMAEDERFYRYGRFFSFQIGLGLTTFDGNRGQAYENEPPTYALGLQYFMDFQTAFGLGFEYSKHHFFIDQGVKDFEVNPPGLIAVSILRFFFSYRYYLDTADLGTAITYAHPYFTGRLEYWYLSNKFVDQSGLADDSGGGFGFGAGFGGEFPIKIKESYINAEFLYHSVNFHDKFTQAYRPLQPGGFGFDDLTGNVWTTIVSYVMSW